MRRKQWRPGSLADQVTLLTNFTSKIGTYAETLGWTPAQVTAALFICAQMIDAIRYAEACRATMKSVNDWRDRVLHGEPAGGSAMPIPAFPPAPDFEATRGCFQRFARLREEILMNAKYTTAIGEDLGLIGQSVTPPSPETLRPNLKVTVTSGDQVKVSGSMHGMNLMKIVYTPQGGAPREVAVITSTPAGFTIAKTDPARPENGALQAVFYKKNAPFGSVSPSYPITLA